MLESTGFAWYVSEVEGSMLAGFLEGEVHLGIRELNGGQSLSCFAQTNVRDDDAEILEWLVALAGIGSLRRVPARRTSKPQVQWLITTRADCAELATVLARFPFRGRKRRELEVWSAAVTAWSGQGDTRRAALRAMTAELRALRAYSPAADALAVAPQAKQALWGYISGFLLAEGSFRLTASEARATVNLRADDLGLLKMLARESGLGAVSTFDPGRPLNPVARWTIASRADLSLLGSWLLDVGLPGHKGAVIRTWAHGVGHLDLPAQRRLVADRLAIERPYVAPQRRALLAVARPELRDTCKDALLAWASTEDGALSCTRYVRWRCGQTARPTRNTIVRQFGSWHGALTAAGLGDRAARGPRLAGGEDRRAAQRRTQRERVVAAVREFERDHGRLPRALEFFRWRLESAIEAPTQGTVYRLFPGGWAEVLQAAGATV
jgi:hypothetical protein